MAIQIVQARPEDADTVATLVGELLQEIMAAVKDTVFDFHHDDKVARAHSWLKDGLYTVLLAYEGSEPSAFWPCIRVMRFTRKASTARFQNSMSAGRIDHKGSGPPCSWRQKELGD